MELLRSSIKLGPSADQLRLSAVTLAFATFGTGSGDDSATFVNASLGRVLSVLLGKGDDNVELRSSQLGSDFRVDGGPGTNLGVVVDTQHEDGASNKIDTVVDDLQFIATLAKR